MKTTALFILTLVILIGCSGSINIDLLNGEWEISTWIDSRNSKDILKTHDAPIYKVRFDKDSVYILEIEENKTHNYKFKWELTDDSLKVGNLGLFKIEHLHNEKCILSIKTRPLFTSEMEFHTETLTLIRNRNLPAFRKKTPFVAAEP